MKTAEHYLTAAAEEMRERAASRDQPDGERSMAACVAAFNALYDLGMTETQGWEFMSILKKARGSRGQYREDDYTDDVAYAALAAESAAKAEAERPRLRLYEPTVRNCETGTSRIPESSEGGIQALELARSTAGLLYSELEDVQRGTSRIAPVTDAQMNLQTLVNAAVNNVRNVSAAIDGALHAARNAPGVE